MIEWQPIAREALLARIEQGEARMTPAQLRLWQGIRIEPEKWLQQPHGEAGGGFWVVGIVGRTVVWYNDIEDGFNRSTYIAYGRFEDYWCNQDELEVTIKYLMNVLEHGADLARLRTKPTPVPQSEPTEP
jgi:hypothetical protein